MGKIVLSFFVESSNQQKVDLFLNKFEKQGYIIHSFSLKQEEIETLTLDSLEQIIAYLSNSYGDISSILLVSNIKLLLFGWYRFQLPYINRYIYYLDSIDEYIKKPEDLELQLGLNDYKHFTFTPIMNRIEVYYEDAEQLLPLLVNYHQFIDLYTDSSANNDENTEETFEGLISKRIFKEYSDYMTMVYKIPQEVLHLIYVDYFYNEYNQVEFILQLYHGAEIIINKLDKRSRQNCIDFINKLQKQTKGGTRLSLLSFLFELEIDQKYLLAMTDDEITSLLDFKEKYVLLWQLNRLQFVGKLSFSKDESISFRAFYKDLVEEIMQYIQMPRIEPVIKRNKDRVVVLSGQLLGLMHAPTRNVLDYSYHLKKLNKEVFIINTTDIIRKLHLPFYKGFLANQIKEYDDKSSLEFNDEKFKFYQAKNNMPSLDEIQRIITGIVNFNPEFILSVGDLNITADICSKFTTVIHVPCGGVLPKSSSGLWAVPRKPLETDKQFLRELQYSMDDVFYVKYAFMKKEKAASLLRGNFDLPENAFIATIVGNRLDEEVTEEFLQELEKILIEVPEVYFLFVGEYKNYQSVVSNRKILKSRSKFIGFQKDIQAVFELCNAYINPPRQGGATSGSEALLEGLPVITKAHGDVYFQLWLDESYNNTDEVISFLKKCLRDTAYYEEQRKKARNHATAFYDTSKMMQDIIYNVRKRIY